MVSPLLHITLVQFDTVWEKPAENFQRVEYLLSSIHGQDLIVLPEMWSTGFSMRPESVAESSGHGPALQWMKEQSKLKNAVIAGSVSVSEGRHYYNRCYFTFPEGHVAFYDKKHLFSYGKEDQHYTSGDKQVSISLKGWKIRPVICYDLRFPAWCRNTDDYDLLLVVANWPVPRIHHWDALLKARAIENQAYVAAVNRTGTDGNGLAYNGHSSIYDMNGMPQLFMEDREEVCSLVLDRQMISAYRDQFRFLPDRDHFDFRS